MFKLVLLVAGVISGVCVSPTVYAGASSGPVVGKQRPAPIDYRVTLGGVTFDPAAGLPALPIGWGVAPGDAEGADLHLVQLSGPSRDAWIESIEQTGARITRYVQPYAYIIWCEPEVRDVVAALPFVRAGIRFVPAFRVPVSDRAPAGEVCELRVLLCRSGDVGATLARIADCGAVCTSRRVISDCFEQVRLLTTPDRVPVIAGMPGVYSVKSQPMDGGERGELSAQFCAGNADLNGFAFPGYTDWLSSIGLDGTGVIIASVDSGADDDHPDLADRMMPCAGDTCGGAQASGHGSITAGIIVGDGSSGVVDANGFLRGLGIAPGAHLVEQLYNPTFTQAGGMRTIIRESSQNGAIVSGNSWGPSGVALGYDDDTMQVDMAVRDADPTTPGLQAMTYVLSIFNGNGGVSTQGTPDDGKNLIAVGSTVMQINGSGVQSTSTGDISENSGHGPARDGRKLPHLVAPGCWVDSTIVSGLHNFACGTSMASPHVTGAIALFIERYRVLFPSAGDPSPALIKAALLSSCVDLAGGENADGGALGHAFDNQQGWGRLDVRAFVAPVENSVRYIDAPLLFDDSTETWTVEVEVIDTNAPVRCMLVWTDAPGHGLGGATPAWNNDLDLEVTRDGALYRGNVFGPDGWSMAGGSADAMNNTEGVFLAPGTSGTMSITVRASNINSDGVPGTGDITDQDFALVIVNATDLASAELCSADCAPVHADLTWGNGEVNVDDLIAVINAYGSSLARCDVAPIHGDGTAGNGTVNIDDIIGVIVEFGPCD
jgi:subtilisin family serine protease